MTSRKNVQNTHIRRQVRALHEALIDILGVLNRPHELKLHVKGALKNGVTKEEIKEVLLQVAVYAGFPAGIDGFRNAREALKEVEGG